MGRRASWQRDSCFVVLCSLIAAVSLAQPTGRRLTTIESLRQFPGFYHLQAVLVRGELFEGASRVTLRNEDNEMRVLLRAGERAAAGTVDVRATLIDVGRLEPGDPRLAGYQRPDDDRWPKPGEELILDASAVAPSPPPGAPSMRALALQPWRFEGQKITLVGQFRGRNLFGDLPGAPRKSQYDFVLKSGEAAVWIVGLRPRGKGFDLDVNARVDTSRWLEVTGIAKQTAGLVTIEAARITASSEPKTITEPEELAPPPPPQPVEVVFSSPTEGEADVPAGSSVRVQFARNVRTDTLKERVKVSYLAINPDPQLPPLEWQTSYDPATRALELKFTKPLQAFRTVKVELLDGILAFDGAPVLPWTLTFTVGG